MSVLVHKFQIKFDSNQTTCFTLPANCSCNFSHRHSESSTFIALIYSLIFSHTSHYEMENTMNCRHAHCLGSPRGCLNSLRMIRFGSEFQTSFLTLNWSGLTHIFDFFFSIPFLEFRRKIGIGEITRRSTDKGSALVVERATQLRSRLARYQTLVVGGRL